MKRVCLVVVCVFFSACSSIPVYEPGGDGPKAFLSISLQPDFGSSNILAFVHAKDSSACNSPEKRIDNKGAMVKGERKDVVVNGGEEFAFDVEVHPSIGDSSSCFSSFYPVSNGRYEATILYGRDKGCSIKVVEVDGDINVSKPFFCK